MSTNTAGPGTPSAEELRAAFDAADAYTIGIEDELLLLDPDTLELVPRAQELLARTGEQERFKLELPAAQFEIVTPPFQLVDQAAVFLLQARRDLARAGEGLVRPACAGVHPFSSGGNELNELPLYRRTLEQFGGLARREQVCALQVHVAVGDADRALAVYNAARSYLPLLAALAANAPFYEGRDTGLASIRPKLAELLPRQGVPPAFDSWEQYSGALEWGASTDGFDSREWWWELRPHWRWGTLEFRVPDGQITVADAAALAAVAQALVAWLAERHQAGERLPAEPSWQIAENRFSALRYGVLGSMAAPDGGERRTTRALLEDLLSELEARAQALGAAPALARAGQMVGRNGAIVQREVAAQEGVQGLARWLAARFLEPSAG